MEAFLKVYKPSQFDLFRGFEVDIMSSNCMSSLEVAAKDTSCFDHMITKVTSLCVFVKVTVEGAISLNVVWKDFQSLPLDWLLWFLFSLWEELVEQVGCSMVAPWDATPPSCSDMSRPWCSIPSSNSTIPFRLFLAGKISLFCLRAG